MFRGQRPRRVLFPKRAQSGNLNLVDADSNRAASVIVGSGHIITKTITVRNAGSEPAYNIHLNINSAKRIDPPRQLDCEDMTDDGGEEGGVGIHLK